MTQIQVKSPISGWRTVSKETALKFAISRYKGITCKNKYNKVCQLIKGITFTEQELINGCRN